MADDREYRCSAGENCLEGKPIIDLPGTGNYGRFDGEGIYAGKWHSSCWARFGYADFKLDPSYAGERLEEDY